MTESRWHIRVRPKTARLDGHGRSVLGDVRRLGLDHIEGVRSSKVYMLTGRLDRSDVDALAASLFCDPVSETCTIGEGFSGRTDDHPAIEVHRQPGVMNPVALTACEAIARWLIAHGRDGDAIANVHTGRRYEIIGAQNAEELDDIARRVLANDCIETWYIHGAGRDDAIPESIAEPPTRAFELRHVTLRKLDDAALALLSREGHLFLSLEEMQTLRDHFDRLGREPTDLELETLAQTWSEHCVHKTLKSAILYEGDGFGTSDRTSIRFDNLLKETIVQATTTLNRDWCLSVFVDNAGVIAFDNAFGIAFKAETHNHPSAIEPYGGAATGIGGCIRDVMGCGLGAKPIASTDVFCLATPTFDTARLPEGVLHPRRVLQGVVGGVRDYGNRMGIPTVGGAIFFDDRYLANPLVFCGCVGIIPRDRIAKSPRPGDRIVVAGGRTGRDGIHGATFSSSELTDTHAEEFSHAVQIGNALEEKKVLDAQLIARDDPAGCLYSSVTDCGAGGLSSAVGEMAEELGAVVDLERVPLKYAGLRYDEIWISEAQERMVFSVPPENLDRFLEVFAREEVEATVIGTFGDDRILRVRYEGQTVGELDMAFLHHGLPMPTRKATWSASPKPASAQAVGDERGDAEHTDDHGTERLLGALSELNTASKEWVIRQYDHEVQGRTVIKPLTGLGSGPSDAAVLRPRHDSDRGIAIACGMCPRLADVDPYAMAIAAIDEALRNVICTGADPTRVAILDNFCWPRVDSDESMGALVRACVGARDAAVAYGLPFISGKDSLNNEFAMSEQEAKRTGLPRRIAIPPTLLISALGIVEDVRRCVSLDLKTPGDVLVLASAPVEVVGLTKAIELHHGVSALITGGKVRAAHDVSDGGLAVAVSEMAIASGFGASGLGVAIDVDRKVFGASMYNDLSTTYVLEMDRRDAGAAGFSIIGTVRDDSRVTLRRDGEVLADASVETLANAWRSPLAFGGTTPALAGGS